MSDKEDWEEGLEEEEGEEETTKEERLEGCPGEARRACNNALLKCKMVNRRKSREDVNVEGEDCEKERRECVPFQTDLCMTEGTKKERDAKEKKREEEESQMKREEEGKKLAEAEARERERREEKEDGEHWEEGEEEGEEEEGEEEEGEEEGEEENLEEITRRIDALVAQAEGKRKERKGRKERIIIVTIKERIKRAYELMSVFTSGKTRDVKTMFNINISLLAAQIIFSKVVRMKNLSLDDQYASAFGNILSELLISYTTIVTQENIKRHKSYIEDLLQDFFEKQISFSKRVKIMEGEEEEEEGEKLATSFMYLMAYARMILYDDRSAYDEIRNDIVASDLELTNSYVKQLELFDWNQQSILRGCRKIDDAACLHKKLESVRVFKKGILKTVTNYRIGTIPVSALITKEK
ncbi:MAG: hypothetical protein ACTSUE_13895 [Promethearchaeota archaeon]